LFTEEERPRAVGIWAAANMVAFPIGPILGGWLLSHYWWGWVFLINVPVALLGFAAVAALVPESRSPLRPGIDKVGIATSSGGLVGTTYGLIQAGQHGWGSAAALGPIMAGLAVVGLFFLWERVLSHRPAGQPLVDLSLFASPTFTWGVIIFAVLTLAMIGLLFIVPQYLQGVAGATPQGSGLRLLPVVGGLMVGLLPAEQFSKRFGAKLVAAGGFVIFGAGLGLGVRTSASSGEAFIAAWMAIAGVGIGLTLATVASTALVELPEERAGIGSGVLQALKNVGAPLGSAILGSVLSSAYIGHLRLGGLPGPEASAMRESLFKAIGVARSLEPAPLSASFLSMVRGAFTQGMDAALAVSVGFSVLGLVLALAFLPARRCPTAPSEERSTRDERVPA
ncbi:MAG TPA: MFS transporter, partial [Acidimicrobiales bacterium]|nr:MFS transporter [Acidimicrobiales bacterium]